MFDDFHAPFEEVEDLAADADGWRAVVELSLAVRAGLGRMNDDLIGLRDLS